MQACIPTLHIGLHAMCMPTWSMPWSTVFQNTDSSNRWVSWLFIYAQGVFWSVFSSAVARMRPNSILRIFSGEELFTQDTDFSGISWKSDELHLAESGGSRGVQGDFSLGNPELGRSSKISGDRPTVCVLKRSISGCRIPPKMIDSMKIAENAREWKNRFWAEWGS